MKGFQHLLISMASALLVFVVSTSSNASMPTPSFTDPDIVGNWSSEYYDLVSEQRIKYEETLTFNADHTYEDKLVQTDPNDASGGGYYTEQGNWNLNADIMTFTVTDTKHSSHFGGNVPGDHYSLIISSLKNDTLIIGIGGCSRIFHRK